MRAADVAGAQPGPPSIGCQGARDIISHPRLRRQPTTAVAHPRCASSLKCACYKRATQPKQARPRSTRNHDDHFHVVGALHGGGSARKSDVLERGSFFETLTEHERSRLTSFRSGVSLRRSGRVWDDRIRPNPAQLWTSLVDTAANSRKQATSYSEGAQRGACP